MRRVTITIGVALVVVGVREVVDSATWASLRAMIAWFVGGILVHDLIVVPLTMLAALAVARFVPRTYRSLVQGALGVSAALTLALLPLLSGQGRTAANPSQQPLPYGRNLALILAIVWICAAVLAVRRHRRGKRQRPGQSDLAQSVPPG